MTSLPFPLPIESGYRYAKSHEWVSTGNPDLTSVGISDYAQVRPPLLLECALVHLYLPHHPRKNWGTLYLLNYPRLEPN